MNGEHRGHLLQLNTIEYGQHSTPDGLPPVLCARARARSEHNLKVGQLASVVNTRPALPPLDTPFTLHDETFAVPWRILL